MTASTRRVVVTGLGATTPLGGTVAETWDAILAGQSGARTLPTTGSPRYELPVTFAAHDQGRPAQRCSPRSRSAGSTPPPSTPSSPPARPGPTPAAPEVDPERLGVAIGSGIGGVWTLLDQWDNLREKGPRRVFPLAVPMLMPNAPGGQRLPRAGRPGRRAHPGLGLRLRARRRWATPCDMIRTGRADVVVAGGTEAAVHPLPIAGFAAHAGAVDPQRRPRARARAPTTPAATASCSARVPASSCSRALSTPQARGAQDLRRARRGRACPRTRTTSPRRSRRAPAPSRAMPRRVAARPVSSDGRHRAHQRARHLDPGRRHRRGQRDPAGLRRRRRRYARSAPPSR